jgi:hypothetical protein
MAVKELGCEWINLTYDRGCCGHDAEHLDCLKQQTVVLLVERLC